VASLKLPGKQAILALNRRVRRGLTPALGRMKFSPHFDSDKSVVLSKTELHALADELLECNPEAIERSLAFFASETKGLWHGRARAMMARRFKHCSLSPYQRTEVVACIIRRLETGEFSEQFKDQLRLSLHLDPSATIAACHRAVDSPRKHVQRYAKWAIALNVLHTAA
jgi:hypothetical protein